MLRGDTSSLTAEGDQYSPPVAFLPRGVIVGTIAFAFTAGARDSRSFVDRRGNSGRGKAQAIGRWGNWANQERRHPNHRSLGSRIDPDDDRRSSLVSSGFTPHSSTSHSSISRTRHCCPGSRCAFRDRHGLATVMS